MENRFVKGVKRYFKDNIGIIAGLLVLCTVMSILSKNFLTSNNIFNVLRQIFQNCNLALGMCLVIITGGIDLSVGSNMALCGTLCCGLISLSGWDILPAILVSCLLGAFIGACNGFIISRTGIAPFIVTMAINQICRGSVYLYSGGQPIRTVNESYNFLGNGYVGPVPITIIYTVFFALIVWFILSRTQLGRHIYAVGGNRTAANFAGINSKNVIMIVYIIIGFLAAFSGVIYCARMYSGQPNMSTGAETDAIAAVVLGGTSFSGGVGTIGGVLIGVLVIGVLNNALNLLAVNSFWQYVARGIVILLAVYVDTMKKNGTFSKKKA